MNVSCSRDVYCMRETDKQWANERHRLQNSRGPAGSSGTRREVNRSYQKEQQDEKEQIPQDLELQGKDEK